MTVANSYTNSMGAKPIFFGKNVLFFLKNAFFYFFLSKLYKNSVQLNFEAQNNLHERNDIFFVILCKFSITKQLLRKKFVSGTCALKEKSYLQSIFDGRCILCMSKIDTFLSNCLLVIYESSFRKFVPMLK